jgi:hypothetical protein
MNKKLLISIVMLIPLTLNVTFVAKAASDLTSICLYIAEDDKNRLRKMIKNTRIKVKQLYKDIQCNKMTILRFAMQRKADKSGTFMAKKIPVSLLKKGGDIAWANENGFADSPTTQAIKKKNWLIIFMIRI